MGQQDQKTIFESTSDDGNNSLQDALTVRAPYIMGQENQPRNVNEAENGPDVEIRPSPPRVQETGRSQSPDNCNVPIMSAHVGHENISCTTSGRMHPDTGNPQESTEPRMSQSKRSSCRSFVMNRFLGIMYMFVALLTSAHLLGTWSTTRSFDSGGGKAGQTLYRPAQFGQDFCGTPWSPKLTNFLVTFFMLWCTWSFLDFVHLDRCLVRGHLFGVIYILTAFLAVAQLVRSWISTRTVSEANRRMVSVTVDGQQSEDSFLMMNCCEIPLLPKLIHFLVRIWMVSAALCCLDFVHLDSSCGHKDGVCCEGHCQTSNKKYFRLMYRVYRPQRFPRNLLFSKGHVHERGRKGKHQRWKKVNHIGEHLDGFHFLSLRSSFLGAHLRLATVCPVNQQQPGENPPPPEDSGRQTQESRQPQDAASRQWPPESVNNIPWAAFCEEMRRLTTFADAPVTLPVFVIPLARAGFLRLPNGNIVCYFCGLMHNTWQAGDVPADVHRRLSPRCPMVTGINCNNQPVSSVPEGREKEVMQAWSLQGGIARQPGFVQEALDHPGQGQQPPQSSGGPPGAGLPRETASASNRGTDAASLSGPASLPVAQGSSSQAGGVTVGHHSLPSASLSSDAHTGDASAAQQAGQNVGAVTGAAAGVASNNVRDATVGPIIDGTAQPVVPPPSLGQETRDTTRSGSGRGQQVVTYEQLGISTEIPKRPDMAMINARVATYRNWPPANSHTPIQLAEAGFYYAGYADCGRCFFCGGGLKNWERNDNPWIEHARWFARCPYIRQCQGQDFIDIVQDLNATKQHISMDEVRAEINRRRAGGERLQEPIVDPAISGALEMGYTQEQIDRAVQQLHQEGYPLSADKLMDYLHVDGAAGGHDDADDDLDYEPGSLNQLVEENSEIRQQRMCKICLDKEVCIVFLPCGHLVCCAECSPAIRQCPMCRQRVKGRVRAFPG